jgi:hypothetical protein
MTWSRRLFSALVVLAALALAPGCKPGTWKIVIAFPEEGQLSLVGNVTVRVLLPLGHRPGTLVVTLDDGQTVTNITNQLSPLGGNDLIMEGTVNVPTAGDYTIDATTLVKSGGAAPVDSVDFETAVLTDPADCNVLNEAQCLLPYPSSRFLAVDGTTDTGFRLDLPASGLPALNGPALDPTPYNLLDGYSPTAPILMHFITTPDLALSGASRLLDPPGSPVSPPYTGLRTHDDTSLTGSSPTFLIKASTGEQILHFVELDARATGGEIPGRQALIMRAGHDLDPGERYIVAVTDSLVDSGSASIEPEAPFAVLRDDRPTTITEVEDLRDYYEANIFPDLTSAGITRGDLILAFDFTVSSSDDLSGAMLDMQSQAYTWLAAQTQPTFTVDSISQFDCSVMGQFVWRRVQGTYEVPLFLTLDPEVNINSLGVLNLDGNGDPLQNGVTNPPYTIIIPCAALDPVPPTLHPLLLGHGLFGDGEGMVDGFGAGSLGVDYIAGATDWRGLSGPDFTWVGAKIVGLLGTSELNNFPAFADRLKQGMINTLVLSRMMKDGLFNEHNCFQAPAVIPLFCTVAPSVPADGVFPGSSADMFYFGVSLGGIMGTFYASLADDVERYNIDVGAMNFSFLLQRSTQFVTFDGLLAGIGLTDPMDYLLGLSVLHELWVRAEPAGYIRFLRSDVAANTKKILMTVAWMDKQVSNQAQEVLARSLGIGNLDASILQGFEGIPDVSPPQDSALVIYDTGSYDIFNVLHYGNGPDGNPLIPPLANRFPSSKCDPHGTPRISIPVSLDQLVAFLQPGGTIQNFCTGVCDGVLLEDETPNGAAPCDPLSP